MYHMLQERMINLPILFTRNRDPVYRATPELLSQRHFSSDLEVEVQ